MITETQIRDQLAGLLAREMLPDRFEDWFAQATWNMHLESDEPAQTLASTIGLMLAEHSSGHLSEEELLEELAPLVEKYTVTVGDREGSSWSGAVTDSGTVFHPAFCEIP